MPYESGAGFLLAAVALCGRLVAEMPLFWIRGHTGALPPAPYGSDLLAFRWGALGVFVAALVLVATGCRRPGRSSPAGP